MFELVCTYTFLSLTYLLWSAANTKVVSLKVILKIAPIVTLQFYVLVQLFYGKATSSETHLLKLFVALLFSSIGDVLLVYQANTVCFLTGILAFSVQQMLYTSLFGAGYDRLTPFGILVGIITLIIYLYLLPKMKEFLVLPAAVYCCLIGCMLWRALVRFQVKGDVIGVTGAVVFYISDSLLAVNKFRHQLFLAEQLIMTTYYTAQLCITISMINSL
ncbi:lysoplasmalogenase TMEM86A-like [Dysidea avara]|uniref:lysoplasmalogenase TMEM86A-like n=1 Tax=Dysidea avara TaxID=196820 RepID=UPI0033253DA5